MGICCSIGTLVSIQENCKITIQRLIKKMGPGYLEITYANSPVLNDDELKKKYDEFNGNLLEKVDKAPELAIFIFKYIADKTEQHKKNGNKTTKLLLSQLEMANRMLCYVNIFLV